MFKRHAKGSLDLHSRKRHLPGPYPQKLCLIELSEEKAKKMIAKSEKIIYNEIHQRLWRNW